METQIKEFPYKNRQGKKEDKEKDHSTSAEEEKGYQEKEEMENNLLLGKNGKSPGILINGNDIGFHVTIEIAQDRKKEE